MRVFGLIFGLIALPVMAIAADGTMGPEEAVAAWEADKTRFFNASEVDLDDFQFIARPLVVFANNPRDPDFQTQVSLLERDLGNLETRDVILILDSDPAAASEVRTRLRPRGFQIALIAKDGRVNLRKPSPWSVREITRSIDKMPIRQQEVRDRNIN